MPDIKLGGYRETTKANSLKLCSLQPLVSRAHRE
jgi:hypothetical protein